jgi:hypothetical protein
MMSFTRKDDPPPCSRAVLDTSALWEMDLGQGPGDGWIETEAGGVYFISGSDQAPIYDGKYIGDNYDCPLSYLGDGTCDPECDNARCCQDGGDCVFDANGAPAPAPSCEPQVRKTPSWPRSWANFSLS